LEFPVVFGVGMNEKIFPSWRSNTPQDLQEERRLAYVMITRAEKKLFLTSTEKRASPNGKGVQTYESSRLIDELSEELVNKMSLAYILFIIHRNSRLRRTRCDYSRLRRKLGSITIVKRCL